eukprot:8323516-Alexandrium_andersonii.AAC.1
MLERSGSMRTSQQRQRRLAHSRLPAMPTGNSHRIRRRRGRQATQSSTRRAACAPPARKLKCAPTA